MSFKVLIVGADTVVGGVSEYVQTLASCCGGTQFEIHITISGEASTPSAPRFEGATTHTWPLRYSVFSLPIASMRLRRLVRAEGISIMHLHTARAGLAGVLAGYGLGTPIVYTGHGWRFAQKSARLARIVFYGLERVICSRARFVTFLGRFDRDFGIARGLVDRNDAVTIPTRIDFSKFTQVQAGEIRNQRLRLGIPEGCPVVGMAGRLEPPKDPVTFIRAAAEISKLLPKAYFLWVGEGGLRAKAEALAAQLRVEQFIVSGAAPKTEIPALLRLMDVFLFASQSEVLPLVIMEAQASGVPVVAAACSGGVNELITHERTGLLYPPGDYQGAAKCVVRILKDPVFMAELARRAAESAALEHSDPQVMWRQYEAVYSQAIHDSLALRPRAANGLQL